MRVFICVGRLKISRFRKSMFEVFHRSICLRLFLRWFTNPLVQLTQITKLVFFFGWVCCSFCLLSFWFTKGRWRKIGWTFVPKSKFSIRAFWFFSRFTANCIRIPFIVREKRRKKYTIVNRTHMIDRGCSRKWWFFFSYSFFSFEITAVKKKEQLNQLHHRIRI